MPPGVTLLSARVVLGASGVAIASVASTRFTFLIKLRGSLLGPTSESPNPKNATRCPAKAWKSLNSFVLYTSAPFTPRLTYQLPRFTIIHSTLDVSHSTKHEILNFFYILPKRYMCTQSNSWICLCLGFSRLGTPCQSRRSLLACIFDHLPKLHRAAITDPKLWLGNINDDLSRPRKDEHCANVADVMGAGALDRNARPVTAPRPKRSTQLAL